MNSPSPVVIGRTLELRSVHAVARHHAAAALAPEARASLQQTRTHLEAALARGETIYGVNTGFGALSDTRIGPGELGVLQQNLLRSHAVGVGPALSGEIVRALLLLRAHTLAMGASGVTPGLPEFLLTLLAADLRPVVPSQGSVGASGDLAPLAHLALALIGEGDVWYKGHVLPAREALAAAGLQPRALGPKEGLSLINGTQVMTAIGALALVDAAELIAAADVVGALSLDALLGTAAATDPRIHAGKPHAGQRRSAEVIRGLLAGSPLNDSHRDCGEVQDAYALRCMPQVHGAARDAFAYVAGAVRIELNSFTDNPLVLAHEGGGFDVLSGGNFHAGTVALPLDHMTAALTTLATISERRTDRMLNPATSRGLPAFLAERPGVESGLMMAHVTASALASECKSLSFPASVDTIPTSAGKGTTSAWGRSPPASCGASSTTSRACSPSRRSPPPAASTCASTRPARRCAGSTRRSAPTPAPGPATAAPAPRPRPWPPRSSAASCAWPPASPRRSTPPEPTPGARPSATSS
jgi:histidine ammonia-lyase